MNGGNASHQIKIDTTEAIEEATRKAKELLSSELRDYAGRIIRDYMRPKGQWGQAEGDGHKLLRDRIETYMLSDRFSEAVDRAIDKVAEPVIESCVKDALRHAAGRLVSLVREKES